MGKGARAQLSRALNENLITIHETFQVLDRTPAPSLKKVSWKEVIQMGEHVSKQATTVGILYGGESPGVKALEENMSGYFNMLQGFLLLSHGSSVGAGPTLSSCIQKNVKQVVDSSYKLLHGAVSSYGSSNESQKFSLPQLVGAVWDACSALKKTPATNITAIGQAMTEVTVSMKDVLREMKEMKPASGETSVEEAEAEAEAETEAEDADDPFDGDLGNDLSPEEMKIAQLTITVVSEALAVIKELIRCIMSLLQLENSENCAISVDSLEKLLKLCQVIRVQVEELGACLYPPQEISAIKVALGKISSTINETGTELGILKGSTEDFSKACNSLRSSLRQLESELGCADTTDLVPQMENLAVSN